MNSQTATFYICILGMIGGACAIVNSILPGNSTALVGTAILTACFALFIALLSDIIMKTLSHAITGKELEDQTSVLSAVIGKTLLEVLKEDKTVKKP